MNPWSQPLLTRWRPLWRSLRFRLAVWNAIVMAAIALVMLIGVRQGVQWALRHEFDQLLQEDVREISLAIEALAGESPNRLDGLLDRKAEGHHQHGWFAQLFDAHGRQIFSSIHTPDEFRDLAPSGNSTPYSIARLRVLEVSTPPDTRGIARVRVGASLELLRQDMAIIDRLIFAASVALVIVAPLCGYWLAGRAAHTLGTMIQTASRLRPNHLDERLNQTGTGDELDKLAVTINGLLDRIGVYLNEKRDFLANAAHELRTPLAAIRSSAEVALTGNRTPEEYESLLADLIDQSTSLEVLVNQLLLISETETDQWKHRQETVSLQVVVRRAVEMFRGVAESQEIQIVTKRMEPVDVAGSARHLRQVVNNLIDNAIKYSKRGGVVDVSLIRCDQEPGALLVITDQGIGISSEDVPKVFDRFFRADRSRSRGASTQGTGLGLSICQAVVTAHGGRISCQSELHEGTTITVWLPLAPPETERFVTAGNLVSESGPDSNQTPDGRHS